MKIKRMIVFLLCASVLLACAGCGTQSLADVVGLYYDADGDSKESSSVFDYEAAYKAFNPDDVMATVTGGYDVTWQELYYWLYNTMTTLESNYSVTDWNVETSEGITYGEYALKYAINQIMKNDAILYKAEEKGLSLGDEGEAYIQSLWDNQIKTADCENEEEFINKIAGVYLTKDLFWKIYSADYLKDAYFTAEYGENGENMADEDILAYFADQGQQYYYIKQITINITDENGVAYEGDALTPYYDRIKEIKDQLDSYSGDDLNGYFTELMNEYSEDERLTTYANGYLFSEGIMDATVEEATKNLAENAYSDIVQSSYAYHIILRLPVDTDMVPFSYSSTESAEPLRYTASHALFDNETSQWIHDVETVKTALYDDIDFTVLFPSK